MTIARSIGGHQHGLGADVVGFVDGAWTWDLPASCWQRLHAAARRAGLEYLDFEQPHLQAYGFNAAKLKRGPEATADWLIWLEAKHG
jgi:hypothetical protein